MNSGFKSLLWLIAAGAAIFFGFRYQKDREISALEEEYNSVQARAAELSKETAVLKEKLNIARAEQTSAGGLESAHNASLENIAAEQKKIETLLTKWPQVDAERVDAVNAVREKEKSRAPGQVILTDGTKLEQFIFRSVSPENLVSVEHSSGLVKLTVDKLPADLKERLGLEWNPQPPPTVVIDKQGNAVIKQAEQKDQDTKVAAELALNAVSKVNAEVDSTTVEGVARALAFTGSQLEKVEKAFEEERVNIRRLGIFKNEVKDSSTGKTYAQLKKEANSRLSALAGRIKTLRSDRARLEDKMKRF